MMNCGRGIAKTDILVLLFSAVKLFLNTIVSGKVTRKGKVRLVDSLADLAKDLKISQ
jgi:hypothetical protein